MSTRHFWLGVILAFASCVLAFGLWLQARWAWVTGLLFTAWFAVSGILSIASYLRSPDMQLVLSPLAIAFFAIAVLVVTVAFGLLLSPSSRAACRRQAG